MMRSRSTRSSSKLCWYSFSNSSSLSLLSAVMFRSAADPPGLHTSLEIHDSNRKGDLSFQHDYSSVPALSKAKTSDWFGQFWW